MCKALICCFPFTVKIHSKKKVNTQQNHGLNNLKGMDLIWYITILCVVKSCYADFFSDLDKLDIDAQLHEIDIMLEKLDDESDDLVDDDSDTFDGFTGGPCKFKCKKGKYINDECSFLKLNICHIYQHLPFTRHQHLSSA